MLGLAETGDSPPPQKAAEAIVDDRSGTAHRESLNDRLWRSGPVDADTARGRAPVADGLRYVLSRDHAERPIAAFKRQDGDASVVMNGG